MNRDIVTRFAPSPTGFMHVGSVRTALFSFLYARKHGGTFILRIEDTDKEREVEGSVAHIVESLSWLGLSFDEGVEVGGPHAPYIQSQRLALYAQYARTLYEKGYAYPDPYAEEEVEALRARAQEEKRPFLYRDHRPRTIEPWDGLSPLRFKVPELKRYILQDLVRGERSAGEEALDDFILMKGDGYPTYNFSHVVDDIEMNVTHVMRGEEFISSTPKFLSLYEALAVAPPQFATMPVILAPDGKKKLSKRDGAKDILAYKKEGYLPEAFINFLALLGWSPGDDREILTIPELIDAFDLSGIQKGGARLDEQKLRWINHEHLKKYSTQEFASQLTVYLQTEGISIPSYLKTIAPLLQERYQTFGEVSQALQGGEFSFMSFVSVDLPLVLKGAESSTVKKHLEEVRRILENIPDDVFGVIEIRARVFPYADKEGRGSVLWPLRVALSGKEKSPDPFTIADMLGKQESLSRIEKVLKLL